MVIKPQESKKLTSLELFAGAGGLSLGVHQAGFQHLGLIEWDESAAKTLKANSKQLLGIEPDLVLHRDAREVDYSQFEGVDLLSGGPNCQPFSMGGLSLGDADLRNMFPVFFNAKSLIMPKASLLENVRGLLREKFKDYFSYIQKRLEFPLLSLKEGEDWRSHYYRLQQVKPKDFADCEQYEVDYQLVDTADFGVPQRRERIVITSFRRDLGIKPIKLEKTHSKEALLIDQWINQSYWERHGISPHSYLSKTDRKLLERIQKKLSIPNDYLPWITIRDAIKDLPDPVQRGYQEQFPNHIQHPGARTYKCHIGSFYDHPAKALKAGTHGTPGGENMVRVPPDDAVRYFTTREAARLQSFPDEWLFQGAWGACIRQLGNAVPVEIAKLFAGELYKRLVR